LKYLKYLLLVAIGMAIIAAIITYKREAIVREIANSALSEYGFTATELSIDTLAADHVILSWLVLMQDDGSLYELSNVSFPLSFPSFRMELISIGALTIRSADTADEPLQVSRLLQDVLKLPQLVPNTTVTLNRLTMTNVPPVQNLLWRSSDFRQQLAFGIDSIDVNIEIEPAGDNRHRATMNAGIDGGSRALDLTLDIARGDAKFIVEGTGSIGLSSWLPMLQSADMLPRELAALDAQLSGPLAITIHDTADRPLVLGAEFDIAGNGRAAYAMTPEMMLEIRVTESAAAKIGFEYPSLDWTASIPESRLNISTDFIAAAEGRIKDLSCQSGIHCSLHFAVVNAPVRFGDSSVGGASLSTQIKATIGDVSRIEFGPDTKLTLDNIVSGSLRAASVAAVAVSGASLVINDKGWDADIAKSDLGVESFENGSGLRASLPVSVRSFKVRNSASSLDAIFSTPARAASIDWDDMGIVAPGINGTASLRDGLLSTSFELSSNKQALTAKIEASHDLKSGKGSLTVQDATLLFGLQKLSERLKKWPHAWDIVAGSWAASANISWESTESEFRTRATVTQQLSGLSGFYNDIAFTGLATSLSATAISGETARIDPSTIGIALVDVGIPITDLSARYDVDLAGLRLAVQDLSMSALGGKISADPFDFAVNEPSNNIMLRPQSIQLQFMVDLAEFEDVELSGSVSGRIPVTINEKTITVSGGRLESDAPGGIIRYKAGDAAGLNAEINMVSRALNNFQFDSLTSDVNYTEAGDLKLKMRMSGINPDMDALQPVILNLGVENNIPQLLRSLQATRAIEDVLKRKSTN